MGDVNRDGVVTIVDLVLVAQKLNQTVSADEPADVNGDGVVNILDLTVVAQAIGSIRFRSTADWDRKHRCCDDSGVDCTGTIGG